MESGCGPFHAKNRFWIVSVWTVPIEDDRDGLRLHEKGPCGKKFRARIPESGSPWKIRQKRLMGIG